MKTKLTTWNCLIVESLNYNSDIMRDQDERRERGSFCDSLLFFSPSELFHNCVDFSNNNETTIIENIFWSIGRIDFILFFRDLSRYIAPMIQWKYVRKMTCGEYTAKFYMTWHIFQFLLNRDFTDWAIYLSESDNHVRSFVR